MEALMESLKVLNLEERMTEEEVYLDFLSRMRIERFSNRDYKTYLSRIAQVYNLTKGGYVNNHGEVFISNKLNNFKDRNVPISKEQFFDILLSSTQIYFYPDIPLSKFLTTDTPYKVLKEAELISF